MAADWVTRGLTQAELVDVVDVGAIYVQGRSAEGAPTDPYELARRNGAGTVVAGSYYLATNTLVIRGTVEDAVGGTVLQTVQPVHVPADAAVRALDRLREHVVVAFAGVFDVRYSPFTARPSAPRSFAAYQSFVAGQAAYWQGRPPSETLALFERAVVEDSTFHASEVWLAAPPYRSTARSRMALRHGEDHLLAGPHFERPPPRGVRGGVRRRRTADSRIPLPPCAPPVRRARPRRFGAVGRGAGAPSSRDQSAHGSCGAHGGQREPGGASYMTASELRVHGDTTAARVAALADHSMQLLVEMARSRLAAGIGDRERAIELLERSRTRGMVRTAVGWDMYSDPFFDALRGDPRFERINRGE